MVGCETAEYLAGHGCKVSIVEMMDKIAAGESTTILPTLMENYKMCIRDRVCPVWRLNSRAIWNRLI